MFYPKVKHFCNNIESNSHDELTNNRYVHYAVILIIGVNNLHLKLI